LEDAPGRRQKGKITTPRVQRGWREDRASKRKGKKHRDGEGSPPPERRGTHPKGERRTKRPKPQNAKKKNHTSQKFWRAGKIRKTNTDEKRKQKTRRGEREKRTACFRKKFLNISRQKGRIVGAGSSESVNYGKGKGLEVWGVVYHGGGLTEGGEKKGSKGVSRKEKCFLGGNLAAGGGKELN